MITGQDKPGSGDVNSGKTLQLPYVDQSTGRVSAHRPGFVGTPGGRDRN